VFGLRQFCDVGPGVLQRDELATARQRDRFSEGALPAAYGSVCLGDQLRVSFNRASRRLVGIAIVREAREGRLSLSSYFAAKSNSRLLVN